MDTKLIAALDVPEFNTAVDLARKLSGAVDMVKIGLEGYLRHGAPLVRAVRKAGMDVFLDLKLHDIPRTAAAGAQAVADLDVALLTVHASGGAEMVAAVREVLPASTAVIAVTVLTSLTTADTAAIGFGEDVETLAMGLASLAMAAGADGVVCSCHELSALQSLQGLRVVPGIRPAGSAVGDQRRVATPHAAVTARASHLVVGRPIVQSQDPRAAALDIRREMQQALSGSAQ